MGLIAELVGLKKKNNFGDHLSYEVVLSIEKFQKLKNSTFEPLPGVPDWELKSAGMRPHHESMHGDAVAYVIHTSDPEFFGWEKEKLKDTES